MNTESSSNTESSPDGAMSRGAQKRQRKEKRVAEAKRVRRRKRIVVGVVVATLVGGLIWLSVVDGTGRGDSGEHDEIEHVGLGINVSAGSASIAQHLGSTSLATDAWETRV